MSDTFLSKSDMAGMMSSISIMFLGSFLNERKIDIVRNEMVVYRIYFFIGSVIFSPR